MWRSSVARFVRDEEAVGSNPIIPTKPAQVGFCFQEINMKYIVYILHSKLNGRYYIGHTSNIEKRLLEHNAGLTYSTRNYAPWEVVFQRNFDSKGLAQHIELKIKRMKSRKFIEKLINNEIKDFFFIRP